MTAASRRPERIGILGGTFDPVHVAHLALAAQACHDLNLDRVLLVVANVPWQKVGHRRVSRSEDRLAMVRAAVAGYDGLEASDMEIRRGGASYTVDTVAELVAPDRELFLIVGSDLVDDLSTWERWEELAGACTLAVASRPGHEIDGAPASPWRTVRVRLPALELSSTELREMVEAGRPVDFLVPSGAIDVIRHRNLYQSSLK